MNSMFIDNKYSQQGLCCLATKFFISFVIVYMQFYEFNHYDQ